MRNNTGRAYRQAGFTLVELLVAIGIIATLSAILLPNFMGARERAKDSQKIQDMSSLKTALRNYYNDNQAYPTAAAVGTTLNIGFGSTYMPGLVNLDYGYTYVRTDSGDGFVICVPLLVGSGDDDLDSQRRCNYDCTGTTPVDKFFAVCAN